MASRPVITNHVPDHLAVIRDVRSLHGKWHRLARRIFRLGVFVPGSEDAIRAKCSEGSVLLVEGNVVDSVDLTLSRLGLLLFSMALEAEVRVVYSAKVLTHEVVIFNAASAFDRSYSVAFSITEHCDSACSVSERGLDNINRVELVFLKYFIKVPGMD